MKSAKLAVGVFGHYGNNNLGDESIIEAVIQNIKLRIPGVEIYGFSIVPEDTAQRHGIESFPIRYRRTKNSTVYKKVVQSNPDVVSEEDHIDLPQRTPLRSAKDSIKKFSFITKTVKFGISSLKSINKLIHEISFLFGSYRVVKNIDILLITGSNQFLDNFGGPWGFPYTLLKWTLLCKLARKKVYFISVGAGPISENLSRLIIRWTLKFADYVSLRDISSEKLIQAIGCYQKTHVFPDIAHSLNTNNIKTSKLPAKCIANGFPVVGINPMPLYDPRYWCEKDVGKYTTYLTKLASFCQKLRHTGYPFFFFATQEKDNNVISDILKKLEIEQQEAFNFDDYTLTSSSVDELIANIAAADISIATRFHGTVLSLLMEKPTLGICYYRKAKELLVDMGQADYTVDLETFSTEELWNKFVDLKESSEVARDTIIQQNAQYAASLNQQYDRLFGSIAEANIPV